MIRRAKEGDIDGVNALLYEVQRIHAVGRPDIFKQGGKKYTSDELRRIFSDERTPVFVLEEGRILGYAFCVFQETKENGQLHPRKVLYVDDLCVDEACRHRHLGTLLYEHVLAFARENGCDAVTLHVWEMNGDARRFYEKMGMTPLKTLMEQKLG